MSLEEDITLEAIKNMIDDEKLDDDVRTIAMGNYLVAAFVKKTRDKTNEDFIAIGAVKAVNAIIKRTIANNPSKGQDLRRSILGILINE